MRLIDADALIRILEEWKQNPNNDDSAMDLVNHFQGIIRIAPTIEPSGEWMGEYTEEEAKKDFPNINSMSDLISREVYEDKVEYYETKIEYLEGELEKHQLSEETSTNTQTDLISRGEWIGEYTDEEAKKDFPNINSMGDLISREDAIKALDKLSEELEKEVEDAKENPQKYTDKFVEQTEWEVVGIAHAYHEIYDLPSATSQNLAKPNKTCEDDLISRAEARTTLQRYYYSLPKPTEDYDKGHLDGVGTAINILDIEVPSVSAEEYLKTIPTVYLLEALGVETVEELMDEPKRGEWEMCEDADGEYGVCSVCGSDADFSHYGKPYSYCPNCGAYMGKG